MGNYQLDKTGAVIQGILDKANELPTNAELTEALAGKEDTIDDLEEIRSGATAGSTAYQRIESGIPKEDLDSEVQSSLDNADSAYQKPESGIPSSDLTSEVQTSLDNADSAYQKPESGIPESDLTSELQAILEHASTVGDGKSAYEIAVDNGFEGTETEWLASLKGETGAAGADGADGADGTLLYPSMEFEPTTGELVVDGSGIDDRTTFDYETGELVIQI